ncbi:hypothetical protein [Pseudomonas sp.]|uniref:hypothetical protein n=1 Tax=Pseudomonas sp. TaxID=306 RepID=UPI003D6F430D
MEGRIHGSVRTTPRILAELQASKESNRKLAARYRLNVKSVAKVAITNHYAGRSDGAYQPAQRQAYSLWRGDGGGVPAAHDDAPGRHAAPKSGAAVKCGKFDKTEMGYLHIDSSELRLESVKQHLFVAIDRVTKFTYVAFFDSATKRNGAEFLRKRPANTPSESPY